MVALFLLGKIPIVVGKLLKVAWKSPKYGVSAWFSRFFLVYLR